MRRSPKLALLAPVVDFGISQLALWHARAEWRLFRRSLKDAEDYLYKRR